MRAANTIVGLFDRDDPVSAIGSLSERDQFAIYGEQAVVQARLLGDLVQTVDAITLGDAERSICS